MSRAAVAVLGAAGVGAFLYMRNRQQQAKKEASMPGGGGGGSMEYGGGPGGPPPDNLPPGGEGGGGSPPPGPYDPYDPGPQPDPSDPDQPGPSPDNVGSNPYEDAFWQAENERANYAMLAEEKRMCMDSGGRWLGPGQCDYSGRPDYDAQSLDAQRAADATAAEQGAMFNTIVGVGVAAEVTYLLYSAQKDYNAKKALMAEAEARVTQVEPDAPRARAPDADIPTRTTSAAPRTTTQQRTLSIAAETRPQVASSASVAEPPRLTAARTAEPIQSTGYRARGGTAAGIEAPPVSGASRLARGAGTAFVAADAALVIYETLRPGGAVDQGNQVADLYRQAGYSNTQSAVAGATAVVPGAFGWSVPAALAYSEEAQSRGIGKTQSDWYGTLKASPLYSLGELEAQGAQHVSDAAVSVWDWGADADDNVGAWIGSLF